MCQDRECNTWESAGFCGVDEDQQQRIGGSHGDDHIGMKQIEKGWVVW